MNPQTKAREIVDVSFRRVLGNTTADGLVTLIAAALAEYGEECVKQFSHKLDCQALELFPNILKGAKEMADAEGYKRGQEEMYLHGETKAFKAYHEGIEDAAKVVDFAGAGGNQLCKVLAERIRGLK